MHDVDWVIRQPLSRSPGLLPAGRREGSVSWMAWLRMVLTVTNQD
jgi:hypothetical protein